MTSGNCRRPQCLWCDILVFADVWKLSTVGMTTRLALAYILLLAITLQFCHQLEGCVLAYRYLSAQPSNKAKQWQAVMTEMVAAHRQTSLLQHWRVANLVPPTDMKQLPQTLYMQCSITTGYYDKVLIWLVVRMLLSINVVAVCWVWLVLGWVCRWINHLGV